MKMSGGLILAHPCSRYTIVLIISIYSVLIHSLFIAGYGRHVPCVVNMSIYLPFQQSEELRHLVGVIRVDRYRLSGVGIVRGDR